MATKKFSAKSVIHKTTNTITIKEISETILERVNKSRKKGVNAFSNSNISQFINESELKLLEAEVTSKVASLLDSLVIDYRNDHNSRDTPRRVAKMLINETYSGRYLPMPSITDFPNVSNLDQLYTVGPIRVTSTCSHHMLPIMGKAWIGVMPGERVIGLSKFHRLARWVMRRPQIQEEATVQLADLLEKLMKPLGIAVIIKCEHLCCAVRGVEDSATLMTTSVVRGQLRDYPEIKQEFLRLVSQSQ